MQDTSTVFNIKPQHINTLPPPRPSPVDTLRLEAQD